MSALVHVPKIAAAIAMHIERLILEGVLRPGEKLAPERELAEKFSVSRPSIREALALVASRGLLVSGRGGTFVTEFLGSLADPLAKLFRDNNQDHRITLDYYEFRRPLEVEAAGLAAQRATEHEREEIRACIERMTAAHELKNPTDEANADADLHILIYEASHNLVVLQVMRAFADMLRQGILFSREQFYLRPGVRKHLFDQHVEMAMAVLAGDPGAARDASENHISFHHQTFVEIREEQKRVEAALRRIGRGELLSS
jgi:GntR family transcriptional regulator, transcriptional repressor for pyruvate dehydrogenase complex